MPLPQRHGSQTWNCRFLPSWKDGTAKLPKKTLELSNHLKRRPTGIVKGHNSAFSDIFNMSFYLFTSRKHPFLVGVAMSAFKTSASDFFAQTVVEKRDQVQCATMCNVTFPQLVRQFCRWTCVAMWSFSRGAFCTWEVCSISCALAFRNEIDSNHSLS